MKISEIPNEKVRDLAVKNVLAQPLFHPGTEKDIANYQLNEAFVWENSPQKEQFWTNVARGAIINDDQIPTEQLSFKMEDIRPKPEIVEETEPTGIVEDILKLAKHGYKAKAVTISYPAFNDPVAPEPLTIPTDIILDTNKHGVDTDELTKLAIYLEGIKAGKGNILPLGNNTIDTLWEAIKHLNDNK
jgi:hypothetical protein